MNTLGGFPPDHLERVAQHIGVLCKTTAELAELLGERYTSIGFDGENYSEHNRRNGLAMSAIDSIAMTLAAIGDRSELTFPITIEEYRRYEDLAENHRQMLATGILKHMAARIDPFGEDKEKK